MPELSHKQFAELSELLRAAENCPRLAEWEKDFLDDLRHRARVHKDSLLVSGKQWEMLKRIRKKVYA